VFIEGWLQLESWEDKRSGQKRSRLRVAKNLQLLDNKERAASPSREAPAAAQNPEFHRHRGSQERDPSGQAAQRTGVPTPDFDIDPF
jgi:single-strand DNA-binding protein